MTIYKPEYANGEIVEYEDVFQGWVRAKIVGAHGVFAPPSYVIEVDGVQHYGPRFRLRPIPVVDLLGDIAR